LYAEDVVVGGEHVEVGRVTRPGGDDGNLRVIDAREVAGTGGLMFFGLEREGVRIDTGHGAAGVVVEGLDLVEILGTLLLEAVLAVEDELHGGLDTLHFLGPSLTIGVTRGENNGGTGSGGDGERTVTDSGCHVHGTRREDDLGRRTSSLTEVPQGISNVGGTGVAPHQFLNGVVVGEADLLGAAGVNTVNASVLHLFDQVFVALLRKSAALFGVQVDVVGPHLECLVEVGFHVGGQIEIDADLMVLQRNQRQVETGVAVEEKHQGQEDLAGTNRRGELTVTSLLGFIKAELSVEPPPLLVLLVNTLTTDRQFDRSDRTFGDPASTTTGSGVGLEFDVHVTDEITVTGDSHGDAAGVAGVTVEGLFYVLHSEVCVTLVFRCEKSYLRISGKVDVLGAVGDELHETTGHFESCCTIHGENNSGGQLRLSAIKFFSV